MTPTTTQLKSKLSFEQFIEQYPEDGRYELVDGEIVRILATRHHEDIADFIAYSIKIVSLSFPDLELTVEQILNA